MTSTNIWKCNIDVQVIPSEIWNISDWQTVGKWCISAHQANCTRGLKIALLNFWTQNWQERACQVLAKDLPIFKKNSITAILGCPKICNSGPILMLIKLRKKWLCAGHSWEVMYKCNRDILKGGQILDQPLTCSLECYFSDPTHHTISIILWLACQHTWSHLDQNKNFIVKRY